MNDYTDTEIALRRTIKDLIEVGERLAEEVNLAAVSWPGPTPTTPDELMHKIEMWDEAVTRAIDPD